MKRSRQRLIDLLCQAIKVLSVTRAEQQHGWTDAQKRAIAKRHDAITRGWERQAMRVARGVFADELAYMLGLLRKAGNTALERKATVNLSEWLMDVQNYLLTYGADEWRRAFIPIVAGVIAQQGKTWAADLGITFDVANVLGADWYDTYMVTFAQPINQTTLDTVSNLVAQAELEGWSIPQMQKRLTQVFDEWMQGDLTPDEFDWYSERMPDYRTEMIARTETMRASNAGTTELFSQWGVRLHEWLATFDDRTRETHAAANGQIVEVGKPFTVGGYQMLYPGDSSLGADPSEFINCRCTTIPVILGYGYDYRR